MASKGGLPFKRTFQQFEHQDAHRPYVGSLIVGVLSDAQDLGRHVLVGPTDALPHDFAVQPTGGPEVGESDVESGVQQDVLGLYVSMGYVVGLQVLDDLDHLSEHSEHNGSREAVLGADEVEEGSVGGELEQKIDVSAYLQTVDEVEEILVLDGLVDADLVLDGNDVPLVEILEINPLEGVLPAVDIADDEVNRREGSSA